MDKPCEDDDSGGSDLDGDPDSIQIPDWQLGLLASLKTNNDQSDSINDIQNYTSNDDLSQSLHTEDVRNIDIDKSSSERAISVPQTQPANSGTDFNTPFFQYNDYNGGFPQSQNDMSNINRPQDLGTDVTNSYSSSNTSTINSSLPQIQSEGCGTDFHAPFFQDNDYDDGFTQPQDDPQDLITGYDMTSLAEFFENLDEPDDITQAQNCTNNSSVSQFLGKEDVTNSDNAKSSNESTIDLSIPQTQPDIAKSSKESTINLSIPQTQPEGSPSQTSTIATKEISVNINGKIMKLNTEKAVIVTPNLLKSLGGFPVTNNNFKMFNYNLPSTSSLSQAQTGSVTEGGQLKITNNDSAVTNTMKTSTSLQPNGSAHFQEGPAYTLVTEAKLTRSVTPKFRIVSNKKNLPRKTNPRPSLKRTANTFVVPNKVGTSNGVGQITAMNSSINSANLRKVPQLTILRPSLNGTANRCGVPNKSNGVGPMTAVNSSTNSDNVKNILQRTILLPSLNGTANTFVVPNKVGTTNGVGRITAINSSTHSGNVGKVPQMTIVRSSLNGTSNSFRVLTKVVPTSNRVDPMTLVNSSINSGILRKVPQGTILRPLVNGTANIIGIPNKVGTSYGVGSITAINSSTNSVNIKNLLQRTIAHPSLNGTSNKIGVPNKVPATSNRVVPMTVIHSSTNSDGVQFQIGPISKPLNSTVVPQLKILGKGKLLSAPNGKLIPVKKGRILANEHNTSVPSPQQIISRVVNSINNGYIENFDSQGIAQLMETHMDTNNGKRKLEIKHDHDYNGTWSTKRSRVLEEEVENEEELGVAETYATYMPSKLKLGRKHPDPVVETASLSSVAPVDVWYKLSIPKDTIDSGALSALQLESITYASQAHEQLLPDQSRAGFLIGDGAGVGKGRTIAGIILENFMKGRERAVWVSISNDLKFDAERDLADIGAYSINVHQLNKFKYNAKISSEINGSIRRGVLFCSYSSLIGESNMSQGKYVNRKHQILQWCGKDFEGLLIFDECHKAKNLCTNGSVKPTKTGKMVLELQEKLPNARVLYASATGASEPKNMAYMVRLGLWGPGTTFNTFDEFTAAVEERGVGGMEIVAMDMKLRGMYIARQLSFQDVKFTIKEVQLSNEFIKIYNTSVKLWVEAFHNFTTAAKLVAANKNMKKSMWGQFWSSHQRFFKYLCIAAKVNEAVNLAHDAIKYKNQCVVIGLQSTGEARTLDQLEKSEGELTDFVSTAKGVFHSLVEKHFPSSNKDNINKILSNISASKQSQPHLGVPKEFEERAQMRKKHIAQLNGDDVSDSDESLKFPSDDEDDCSEDERRRREVREHMESMERANKYIEMIFQTQKMKKQKQQQQQQAKNVEEEKPALPTPSDIRKANEMKETLLKRIDQLGKKLPKNTLDELIDSLGGTSEVAEMTGRKGRVVQKDNGIHYESRSEQDVPLETLNVAERTRFMDGEKNVAIISEAASSGISLQSDRRAKNQKKRLHITLELPWSADKAVQQFGRTHRSNQVSAPEYVFLITNLAGERRFASIVAKRLESLGALTHGDRRASDNRDLSQFNIDNKYGKSALESVMKVIVGKEHPMIQPPSDYKGNFLKDVAEALIGVGLIEEKGDSLALDKDYNQIPKFLNRILGMPVELQNRLFKYFTDTMNAIIKMARRNGTFDLGILDLGVGQDEFIKRVRTTTFLYRHATGIAPIELHRLKIEKGMSWGDAMLTYRKEAKQEEEGFYESYHSSRGKRYVILLIKAETKRKMYSFENEVTKYIVYRPNTGRQNKRFTIDDIALKYRKAEPTDVENLWMDQYNSTVCTHIYSTGKCRFGDECVVGLRIRIYHVLAGSVLPIWQKIEAVINEKPAIKNLNKNKMQVLRLKTTDNRKIVGTLIKNHLVDRLFTVLQEVSESVEEKDFIEESQ